LTEQDSAQAGGFGLKSGVRFLDARDLYFLCQSGYGLSRGQQFIDAARRLFDL